VGPARARALAEAGFVTVRDLLFHLPSRWEDRRAVLPVASALAGVTGTFRGRLSGMRRLRTRRRGFSIVRGTLTDDTGSMAVVWFNRPWLAELAEDTEQEWLLHGTVRETGTGIELLNPDCEKADDDDPVHAARIAPVYPAIGKLGPAALRRIFAMLLDGIDLERIPDPLPAALLARHGLPPLGEALRSLHAPGLDDDPDALARRRSPGWLRLIYGELLELQLALARLRQREQRILRTRRYRVDDGIRAVARGVLPFRLTGAQKEALREIVDDLRGPHPMLRLLQGDVGSGKTIVAALALVVALENGYQGAFMAPTELLAEQHFASLRKLLGERYRLGMLTGSNPDTPRLREALAAGEIQLAVGTHALIQESVRFRNLGLAVIDEQHRFGVLQRDRLGDKGDHPDLLIMTATPIPRSLALALWGDLAVSTIAELPPGRTPVATEVLPAKRRREVYRRLREALAAAGTEERAYVVFPRIEESEQVSAASAASIAAAGEKVRELLAGIPSAVLHGRTPAAERDRIMRAFAAGEIRALISTTIVEVGVDVPEATWMIVESAERFGLSQLHQLRGRVGRGPRPSCCIAVHGPLNETAERRLRVFGETADGFRIAEEDLAIRGPGDLLGVRQAGLPAFRIARLPDDVEWVERARDDAAALMAQMARRGKAPA